MFTTSCYIELNTPEIRERLEKLGYVDNGIYDGNCIITNHNLGKYDYYDDVLQLSEFINCGKNIDLFFALAALQDDSDYMQWFTNDEEWELCEHNKWLECWQPEFHKIYNKWRKATPAELIEHFNQGE